MHTRPALGEEGHQHQQHNHCQVLQKQHCKGGAAMLGRGLPPLLQHLHSTQRKVM